MLAALASAILLFTHAPLVRAQCGTDASAPPCPTPVNAFLSIDVTAGDSNTVINVTGGQFLPNEAMNLYWDTPGHAAGSATADGNGNVTTRVKPYPGDGPGVHRLCASVDPRPCATFTLNGPPSPTPATPSPSESPTPAASPVVSDGPTASPVPASLSGFDVISRPPFVFLPLAGALGIALSLGYWVVSMMRRPRQRVLPTAAVMHRAMRPDYSAGFGTPPQSPAAQPAPSAWEEPVSPKAGQAPQEPQALPPATPPQVAPAEPSLPEVEWGQPVEWGTGTSDWGFPEPPLDEAPDVPQPGD
jgi:hypothetical protein